MARHIGSLGTNFLEGGDTSDRIYGESSDTLNRAAGSDHIYGYDGADFSMVMPPL